MFFALLQTWAWRRRGQKVRIWWTHYGFQSLVLRLQSCSGRLWDTQALTGYHRSLGDGLKVIICPCLQVSSFCFLVFSAAPAAVTSTMTSSVWQTEIMHPNKSFLPKVVPVRHSVTDMRKALTQVHCDYLHQSLVLKRPWCLSWCLLKWRSWNSDIWSFLAMSQEAYNG